MKKLRTKNEFIRALKDDLQGRELSVTSIMVLDSLIELIVPQGPLKRLPKALAISEADLAYMVKRDLKQVMYAIDDLVDAELLQKVPQRQVYERGLVVFSDDCFDISPLFATCGFSIRR